MRTLFFFLFLAPKCLFSQCDVNTKVDPFTGSKSYFMKPEWASYKLYLSLGAIDTTPVVYARIRTSEPCNIRKGAMLMFKMEDGSIYEFSQIETHIFERDGEKYETSFLGQTNFETLDKIANSKFDIVRVETSVGNSDHKFETKGAFAKKNPKFFVDQLRCLKEEINKQQ